ncbi:MAG: trypsin-like peptidase domain-containing protein [Candidatus Melainabacteria bacterium]|nr:trypsin-like peptidase domain-containing protein [Candidatus Melainabacteria bacterium]
MAFDQSCRAPASEFEIPTVKRGQPVAACDRTDYSGVKDMAPAISTSGAMWLEAQNLLAMRQAGARKPLSPVQIETITAETRNQAMQAYDLRQYQIASPGVFRIDQRKDSSTIVELGSGFTVGPEGSSCRIITDHHVVASDQGSIVPNLVVQGKDGSRFDATVTRLSASSDLALLKVPLSAMSSCPSLPLANNTSALRIGTDRATAVGHPRGSVRQFISGGQVERKGRLWKNLDGNPERKPWDDNPTVEVSSQAIGGFSGAPAMVNGEVSGVVQAQIGMNTLVFTPVENMRTFLSMPDNVARAATRTPSSDRIVAGPLDCEYESARQEIAARIARRELKSAEFSGTTSDIKRHYSFTDGTSFTLYDSSKRCQEFRGFKAPGA